jgi:hypothetical protein
VCSEGCQTRDKNDSRHKHIGEDRSGYLHINISGDEVIKEEKF